MDDEKKKILVIEDNELSRKTLMKLLELEGYEVAGAENSQEAFCIAKQNRFELIISDVRLPGGMDGIDVLKNIRQMSDFPSKMFVITAYADEEASQRAEKLGVDGYFFKPFNIPEFLESVRKITAGL